MNYELPEILRKIRVNRNYSQEFVSDQISVSLSSYQRYESGKVDIDFNSVYKLASLYKLTIDELLNYDNPEYKVSEPSDTYLKQVRVSVMIELDGMEATLNKVFKKLSAINVALNQTAI